MRTLIPPDLSGPWHHRRGVRQRAHRRRICAGCSIRSTAPNPSLPACRPGGTLIALDARARPCYAQLMTPAVHPRALHRRRLARALSRPLRASGTLRDRRCAGLDALLMTTSPLLMKEPDRDTFGKVEQRVRLSRYGGDCYAYCMLAARPRRSASSRPSSSPTTSCRSFRSSRAAAASSPPGTAARRSGAAASSRPAIRACTKRAMKFLNG